MTNSERKRDSAVMISSTMPSAKAIPARVTAHVLEGQHGDGGLGRKHQGRRIGGRRSPWPPLRRWWRSGLNVRRRGPDSPTTVAASRRSRSNARRQAPAQHPTQGRDLDHEVVLLDGKTRPRGVDQGCLTLGRPAALHEHAQHATARLPTAMASGAVS